jgi:hypothetical protein
MRSNPQVHETAPARAKRAYWSYVTGDKWCWACLAICGLVGTGAGIYFSWGRGRGGTVAVTVAAAAIGLLVALLLIFGGLAVVALRNQRDEVRAALGEIIGLLNAVQIEAGPCARYGRADYVLHITVRNAGPQATFSAQITSNLLGLEAEYGAGNELIWEHPQAPEKRLGKGQVGLLRLASFERRSERLMACFFAAPEFRHSGLGGYLPTMPYRVAADTMEFEFCVRNIDKDVPYRRTARITFAPDGRPDLELREVEAALG